MSDKEKSKISSMGVLRFSFFMLFSGLFFFSMGVFVGKNWSDRQSLSDTKTQKTDKVTKKEFFKQEKKSHSGTKKIADKTDREAGNNEGNKKERNKKDKKGMKHPKRVQRETGTGPVGSSTQASYTSIGPPRARRNSVEKEEGPDLNLGVLPKGQGRLSYDREMVSSQMELKPKKKLLSYTIQVAAYKTEGEAKKHTRDLIDRGFPAFSLEKTIGGKKWFRVNIGSFKTKKEAFRYGKALKKQTWIKKSFVRKVVHPVTGND